MSFNCIVMPYKENCKIEGKIITKFKIARLCFSDHLEQKDIELARKIMKEVAWI